MWTDNNPNELMKNNYLQVFLEATSKAKSNPDQKTKMENKKCAKHKIPLSPRERNQDENDGTI